MNARSTAHRSEGEVSSPERHRPVARADATRPQSRLFTDWSKYLAFREPHIRPGRDIRRFEPIALPSDLPAPAHVDHLHPSGLLRPRSNFCSETSWRSHGSFTSPPRIQTPCKIRTIRSSTDHPSNSSCRRVRSRRSRSPNHHEEHLGSLSPPPINRTNQAAFSRQPEAAPSVIAPRAT